MEIKKGIMARAVKTVLYGVEGIGKTTFASKFPSPLFIDLDHGTSWLDVDRVEDIKDWETLLKTMELFTKTQHDYKTLVIDTADAAAMMCANYIIARSGQGKRSIEDIPYGKGYKMLTEEFSVLMYELERIINKGFHVVVLAHAQLKTITKPDEMGQYDHWELKLPANSTNRLSPLLKEWADLLIFASYKTKLVTDQATAKKKAKGGERIMYLAHTPYADAKNRFNLPDVAPFDYKEISHLIMIDSPKTETAADVKEIKKGKATTKKAEESKEKEVKSSVTSAGKEKLVAEFRDLFRGAGIEEFEVQEAVALTGQYASNVEITEYSKEYLKYLIDNFEEFKRFVLTEIGPFKV